MDTGSPANPGAASPSPSNPLTRAMRASSWNAYIVGTGIGVLSWITFLVMGKALGTSTSYVHAAGLAEGAVASDRVVGTAASPYYGLEIKNMFDWQFLLVVGVLVGAVLSSRLSGERIKECVPSLWAWRFGGSKTVRYLAAFFSGFVMLFGARMAGGCTSGHGISGGLQLALSSWVFFIAMFVSGVATAFALFGIGGRRHVLQ